MATKENAKPRKAKPAKETVKPRKAAKKSAVAPAPVVSQATIDATEVELFGKNPQMWKHEHLAEYISQTRGIEISAVQVAAVVLLRSEWRDSDSYRELVENHRAEKYPYRAAAKAALEEAANEAVAEQAAKKAARVAKRTAKEATKETKETKPAAKGSTKAAPAKATKGAAKTKKPKTTKTEVDPIKAAKQTRKAVKAAKATAKEDATVTSITKARKPKAKRVADTSEEVVFD